MPAALLTMFKTEQIISLESEILYPDNGCWFLAIYRNLDVIVMQDDTKVMTQY